MSDKVITILVADDDEIMRYLAKRQLIHLGYQCDVVSNGKEAVTKASEQRYDIILMDVQMPVMTGLEATAAIRLRESESTQDSTPIVAMTANPQKKLCIDAGMNDFMFKPVSLDQLKATLDRWVA